MQSLHRLFIGLSVDCPWPHLLPKGRLIREEERHMTLCFLGHQETTACIEALANLPSYPDPLAPCGYFEQCIFLPAINPRVVAWRATFEDSGKTMLDYQANLAQLLQNQNLYTPKSQQTWLPHVTICRAPFHPLDWEATFEKLPFVIQSLILYKSKDQLHYEAVWEQQWVLPFEKTPHTADLAYLVRGNSYPSLFRHAQLALAFTHPPLLAYSPPERDSVASLEEIISVLNRLITEEDTRIGCPMKAVSYHCKHERKASFLEWEMIIDV